MAAHDLLFELLTEELPPRALAAMSTALTDAIVKGIDEAGVPHSGVRSFATPRRLAVLVALCADRAPDRRVERRGPPLDRSFDSSGAPTQAATAFAKSCGVPLTKLERLTTEKGSWLVYRALERGAATTSLLGAIVKAAVAAIPIAKRMRWGAHSAEFVRPVRGVVLLYGEKIVPCEILGVEAGRITSGHRFHAPRPLALKSASVYEARLLRAKVVADFSVRRDLIRSGVLTAAAKTGGEALIDDALLDEVTALVEWPVPIAGQFEARFLKLPREVVIATVQGHQRYFPVEGTDGNLSGWFVTVSNLKSRNPSTVREGNERVVRPRLSDAAFFWDQDRKLKLEEHAAKLADVTFQAKLGSYADKGRRVKMLAESIGQRIGAGPDVARAAELAKADLMTAMVGEFPELQGTMGRHYCAAQGEPQQVCIAIEEQYLPRFAGDLLPGTLVGCALALADKIDTLVGAFAIDQKPTGTKDPFGLRRAGLGVLRIVLEARFDLDLLDLLGMAAMAQPVRKAGIADEVFDFLTERLRGLFLERHAGASAEMIDAVLAGRPHSPVDAEMRLQALMEFSQLADAPVLTAINKRIANILRKAQFENPVSVDVASLTEDAESLLYRVLTEVSSAVLVATAARHYSESLRLLIGLRGAVADFFERVMVMDENQVKRNNRLALLRDVQLLLGGVADLSRLPG
jgi:glycyl-tRNA synthetase beta chain